MGLVDDHPIVREGLRDRLRHEPDIEVVGEAADGWHAVRMVEERKPHVVLMDVVMPGISGIEATRRIKKVEPSVAVLILSAYEDDRYVLGLLEAGAAGYLLKSATGDEVVHSIRAIRAGESVLHPSIAARVLGLAVRPGAASDATVTEPLTSQEMRIVQLVTRGHSNKEIALHLNLGLSTVKSHLVRIFDKMNVASRTEAAMEAVRRGWVDMESDEGGSSGIEAYRGTFSEMAPPGHEGDSPRTSLIGRVEVTEN